MVRPDSSLLSLLLFMVMQCSCSTWESSFRYIMADFNLCQREKPDVVMWVQGRAANPARRSIIRELLANNKAWPKQYRVLTFFMVGKVNDSMLQYRLRYEFEVYRDIVQNDYIEHYHNQTAKMMSAISFLSDYCGNSKLAIRIDDDVLFHPATMIDKVVQMMTKNTSNSYNHTNDYHRHKEFMESFKYSVNDAHKFLDTNTAHMDTKHSGKPIQLGRPRPDKKLTNENTVLCHVLRNRLIIRPDMKRPYPVDYSVLVNETIYPEFCAGFFIAFSTDLLPKFQSVFIDEQPFWIDDSYLGVVQKRLRTINVEANDRLLFDVPTKTSLRDLITSDSKPEAIAVHLEQGSVYFTRLASSKALDDLSRV